MKILFNEIETSILDVKEDKRTEIFNWGLDNAFPSLTEALIDMSVTAKTCVDRASKAIYGKGFGEIGDTVVNSSGETLNEIFRLSAISFKKHKNIFLHLAYNAKFQISAINILSPREVRIGKADDLGYSGKFVVYDNWDKSNSRRIMKEGFRIIDRFNPNPEVIKKQVEKAGGFSKYKGQILHINYDKFRKYGLSDCYPVRFDMLLEYNSEVFRSKGASKGFLNSKIVTVQPFDTDDERNAFKKSINTVRGAENAGNILVSETSQQMDDISKAIDVKDLTSNHNDKLFEYSDDQAEKNICKAFTVPLMLVSQTDNSLFGSSGEMLKEAKVQLWENHEEERMMLTEAFEKLGKKFKIPFDNLEVINPFITASNE